MQDKPEYLFDHEKLDVYRVSIEYVAWIVSMLTKLGQRSDFVGVAEDEVEFGASIEHEHEHRFTEHEHEYERETENKHLVARGDG